MPLSGESDTPPTQPVRPTARRLRKKSDDHKHITKMALGERNELSGGHPMKTRPSQKVLKSGPRHAGKAEPPRIVASQPGSQSHVKRSESENVRIPAIRRDQRQARISVDRAQCTLVRNGQRQRPSPKDRAGNASGHATPICHQKRRLLRQAKARAGGYVASLNLW